MFARLGLRWRLSLSILALVTVFAAFFGFYFPRQQEEAAVQGLERQGRSLALILSATAATSMETLEIGGSEALALALERAGNADPGLDYILAVANDGQVVARYDSGLLTTDQQQRLRTQAEVIRHTDGHIHVSVPLISRDKNVGTLTLGLSRRNIIADRKETQRRAFLLSAAIVLAGFLVAWIMASRIARPISHAARGLASVSAVLGDSAREQESTSAQEAAAVAETRRSMETLLDSAQQIATRSSEVLGNAERNAVSNKRIAERIDDLNALSDKVAEILATIMQVADKADLLALNASLEGTKAGEAGKGFTLVAAEMRRLAENVMESVSSIRHLMKDIQGASRGAAGASEEGTRSSSATAESARQIARLTQDQRSATEQVILSMDEMSNVLSHTMEAVQRTIGSAHDVEDLAVALSSLVHARRESTPALGDVEGS